MDNDPIYFSFDEFKARFPKFFVDVNTPTQQEQDDAENNIREAEALIDVYVNCEKCKIGSSYCYYRYLWGCGGFKKLNCPLERTFPRCVDCCPGTDQGSFDPLLGVWPQGTTQFNYWLISNNGAIGSTTFVAGQYMVALSTRQATQERNFEIVDEEPKKICFVPDNIRRATEILIGSLNEINSSSSSGDCLDGMNISIGDFKISNANTGANNETRLPYSNQYYDLLAPFRCRGATIQ